MMIVDALGSAHATAEQLLTTRKHRTIDGQHSAMLLNPLVHLAAPPKPPHAPTLRRVPLSGTDGDDNDASLGVLVAEDWSAHPIALTDAGRTFTLAGSSRAFLARDEEFAPSTMRSWQEVSYRKLRLLDKSSSSPSTSRMLAADAMPQRTSSRWATRPPVSCPAIIATFKASTRPTYVHVWSSISSRAIAKRCRRPYTRSKAAVRTADAIRTAARGRHSVATTASVYTARAAPRESIRTCPSA